MQKDNSKIIRFDNLDGLRVLACFGIIATHIRANTHYHLSGFVWNRAIPSFTWFVYLFLMISGFGMCAGYLDKFSSQKVDLESFYKRRYQKLLPFFAVLILFALLLEPSLENFYEATMEISLLFGLLPNVEMNVLGVCWTLGVIFLFYMLFPFLSVFFKTKKRTAAALAVSLWINFICENYFFQGDFVTASFTPRHSFLYCLPLFAGGALIFHERMRIRQVLERYQILYQLFLLLAAICYYRFGNPDQYGSFEFYKNFIMGMLLLIYGVGAKSRLLSNPLTKLLSTYSMEMYLAHMVIFRLAEKMGLLYLFGDNWWSFGMAFFIIVGILFMLISVYKSVEKWFIEKYKENERKKTNE